MREDQAPRWTETLCTVVLALAATASTWCGYQSSLWGSRQASAFAIAAGHRAESAKAASRAGQQTQVDIALFVAWSEANTEGNRRLADYLRARFRPEFRPAFDEWLASKPMQNPDSDTTPFALPSYQVANEKLATELSEKALKTFADGEYAMRQRDLLMQSTVIFALALFFGGIALPFHGLALRLTMAALAIAFACLGLFNALEVPRITL